MRESTLWRADAERALARPGTVVAVVVDVRGSAFRREGARLFVWPEGDWAGNISGGCLEPDVAMLAEEVRRSGRALTRRYNLAEDEMWGLGLGCGGDVEVLIEPFRAEMYRLMLSAPEGGVRVRLLPEDGAGGADGAHGGSGPDGRSGAGGAPDEAWWTPADAGGLPAELARAAAARYRRGLPGTERAGGRRVFFDVVLPPRRLVVCGAGHDSLPLVDLAAAAGFSVIVVDPRPAYAHAGRFPRAAAIECGEAAEVLPRLGLGPRDAVVIQHHHKRRDQDALAAALRTRVGYIGQLGPRSRTQEMLAAIGGPPPEREPRLRSPVGLDLGAESPEQLAVSIVGELLAWANGHPAGFLRDRRGPIHLAPGAVDAGGEAV
ncbi:MAG: XdhC family protein [Firmicutes bacterium]|nr:XdhC family protein [Bacillota bacterium]